MPLDREELRERIALTGSRDLLRGSVFQALLLECQRRSGLDPRLVALRARHGMRAIHELFYYPCAEWLELLWDACDLIEPTVGSSEAALEAMGEAVAGFFLSSLVGRLAMAMSVGKTPIELLNHAPMTYSAGASYGHRKAKILSPREGQFFIDRDFAPMPYHRGILRRGLGATGQRVEISGRVLGLLSCEFDIAWR